MNMDTRRNISEMLYHLIMILTLGQRVHAMPVPTDVPMCTAPDTAQYSLTFTGKWTQAAFPKQYPVYRPPAQWSNLIGKFKASQQSNSFLIGLSTENWCTIVISKAKCLDTTSICDILFSHTLCSKVWPTALTTTCGSVMSLPATGWGSFRRKARPGQSWRKLRRRANASRVSMGSSPLPLLWEEQARWTLSLRSSPGTPM